MRTTPRLFRIGARLCWFRSPLADCSSSNVFKLPKGITFSPPREDVLEVRRAAGKPEARVEWKDLAARIASLDHPIDIQEGMTFALETQHGKRFRYGVRIEEMLIVKKNDIEIVSNFPVKQITVVDPLPGYGDHVK